jgi:uncharacterized protein (TIGR02147 family)
MMPAKMNVFSFKDYKDFLRAKIEENSTSRGYSTRLAKAASCSRSFLSQVLARSSSIDLTRDHASGLCHFWDFNETEFEYFLVLVDLSRARSTILKEHLKKKAEQLIAESSRLTKRIVKEEMENPEAELIYYSSWIIGAIHILLTIPKFREPKAIAQRLKIEISTVEKSLAKLEEFGLAARGPDGWHATKKNLNIAETSALSSVNHANWRLKTVSRLQERQVDDVHFSSIFSASRKDAQLLREKMKDFIANSRKIILDSAEEELFCFNVDFFEV